MYTLCIAFHPNRLITATTRLMSIASVRASVAAIAKKHIDIVSETQRPLKKDHYAHSSTCDNVCNMNFGDNTSKFTLSSFADIILLLLSLLQF